MVQHHLQIGEQLQAAVEQVDLVGRAVEPGRHACIPHGGQHCEHPQGLGLCAGLALQSVEPDSLDSRVDAAAQRGQRVGIGEVVHGHARELARVLREHLGQVVVVL